MTMNTMTDKEISRKICANGKSRYLLGPPDRALSTKYETLLRTHPPGESVIRALRRLMKDDAYLLAFDANERSITFRFAMYLQAELPEWHVDCEFNRNGVDPKKLKSLELNPDSEDEDARTVFPDVIVHRRGTRENFLVVEFKKSTSSVKRSIDLCKLKVYKSDLKYEHALFIEIGTDVKAAKGIVDLKWVEPHAQTDD